MRSLPTCLAACTAVLLVSGLTGCGSPTLDPVVLGGPDLLVTVQLFHADGENQLPPNGVAVVELYLPIQDDGPPPVARTIAAAGDTFPVEVELTGERANIFSNPNEIYALNATIYYGGDFQLSPGDFITSLSGTVSSSSPPERATVVVETYR